MSEEKEITDLHKRHRHRHRSRDHAHEKMILIGNPNVGKSVIFGLLTGKYVTVSNYPGTTVEVSYGNASIGNKKVLIIDSPGVNNLTPMSEDEKVTRDILLKEKPDAVVLVADAKNLKRALMLLMQIAEMDLSCVLDLNMEDEAKTRGIEIHYERLSELLHIEVIGTVAPQRKGIQLLKNALLNPRRPSLDAHYHPTIEEYCKTISAVLPEANISKRSLSLMILSGDESLKEWLITNIRTEDLKKIEDLRDEAQSKLKEPIPYLISKSRINLAEHIVREVQKNRTVQSGIVFQGLNKWTTHPVLGIPVLLVVIFTFYEFVENFGAGCILLVLIFAGYLASKVVPGGKPDFFIELPPLRMPALGNIVMKTLSRIEWYLKEAVPLFILGTLILFLLDKMRVLGWLESLSAPVVVHFLGLPVKTSEAFLMGFLRRDYAAAGIFDLARRGMMNENQVIVSLVTLTLFVPCLANFFMMVKERGIRTAFLMMALIIPFALLVGGTLNFILNWQRVQESRKDFEAFHSNPWTLESLNP